MVDWWRIDDGIQLLMLKMEDSFVGLGMIVDNVGTTT